MAHRQHRSRSPRNTSFARRVPVLGLTLLLGSAPLAHGSRPSSPAEQSLLAGRVTEAEHLLQSAIAANDRPADHLLLCRALYAEDRFDDALAECQTATAATPPPPGAFLWLGRVQGARAARANPLVAFAIARKVRAAFVKAVELNPASDAAVGDLGQYFVEAPAIVGGGLDQARSLAADSMSRAPSAAHRVLAMAAQHANDPALAEHEFRAAIASAPPAELAGAWIDLARFFVEQDHPQNALAAIHAAIAADTTHDAALVDAARLLTRLHQPPTTAIPLFRLYLASPAQAGGQTDAAPAFKVHRELAALLDQTGDHTAAEHERALALTLAPDFQPAHPAAHSAEPGGQVR